MKWVAKETGDEVRGTHPRSAQDLVVVKRNPPIMPPIMPLILVIWPDKYFSKIWLWRGEAILDLLISVRCWYPKVRTFERKNGSFDDGSKTS